MTGAVRRRVVLYAALPLILPLGLLVFFAANCEDDWCTGGIWQASLYDVGFSAMVLGAAAYFSMRPIHGLRAGLAAWCLAVAVAGLLFMSSQLLESDFMVAMVWAWLSAALGVAAFVLSGRPDQNARTE